MVGDYLIEVHGVDRLRDRARLKRQRYQVIYRYFGSKAAAQPIKYFVFICFYCRAFGSLASRNEKKKKKSTRRIKTESRKRQ